MKCHVSFLRSSLQFVHNSFKHLSPIKVTERTEQPLPTPSLTIMSQAPPYTPGWQRPPKTLRSSQPLSQASLTGPWRVLQFLYSPANFGITPSTSQDYLLLIPKSNKNNEMQTKEQSRKNDSVWFHFTWRRADISIVSFLVVAIPFCPPIFM